MLLELILLVSLLSITFILRKFARKTTIPHHIFPTYLMGKDMHKKMSEYVKETGAHMVEVRGMNTVLVTHPDAVRDLIKYDTIYPKNTSLGKITNNGVSHVIDGDQWRHQRSIVNPAFHKDVLINIIPVFISQTKTFLSLIGNGGENIDIKFWMQKFTLDVLGESIFGQKFGLMKGEVSKYQQAFLELITADFTTVELLFPEVIRLPLPVFKNRESLGRSVMEMTNEVIEKKKRQYEKGISKSEDLLDALISSDLSHEELMNNLWVFFIAGHETTATSLSWALYFLAKYPEFQKMMYSEVMEVLGDRDPVFGDLNDLKFVEMFIKEVLRIFPPFPISTPRMAEKPTELDGIVIPPKTMIATDFYVIHHDPSLWKDPEAFNPLRFSPENSKNHHPFAFLPFFLGRRQCVGMNFSLHEQKILLAMAVQKFEILYCSESICKSGMFCTPTSVHVSLKSRK